MIYDKFYNISNSVLLAKQIKISAMSESKLCELPSGDGFYVGKSSIYNLPFFINFDKLMNKHIISLGMTGSGKTNLLKNLILKIFVYEISPSITIFDWSGEYSDITNYTVGIRHDLKSLGINLLDLYGTDLFKPMVINALENFCGLSSNDCNEIYDKISNGLGKGKLDFNEGISGFFRRIRKPGVGKKVLALDHYKLFNQHPGIDLNRILDKFLCFDLSGLDEFGKSNFSKLLLLLLKLEIYRKGISTGKTNYLVFDEAWKYIKDDSILNGLFREGRKYGVSLLIATQMASDVSNELLSNAASVFIFRLHKEDYKVLGNYGIDSNRFSGITENLGRGSCLVSQILKGGTFSQAVISDVKHFNLSDYLLVSGDNMNYISRIRFKNAVEKYCTNSGSILRFMEENSKLDLSKLIEKLISDGNDRVVIVTLLRSVGIDDFVIASGFDNLRSVYFE